MLGESILNAKQEDIDARIAEGWVLLGTSIDPVTGDTTTELAFPEEPPQPVTPPVLGA